MEQVKIEQFAFLYLCSEHDKRLLFKKEKMQLADFDRLTYLIYHLVFKEYHIKVWMEFTESESRLHEMWIRDFCKNTPMEIREWLRELA